MLGLRETTDGKRDTQLSEQNYAKRTATRLREAKIMKICLKKKKNGLYEPENAIFGLFFYDFQPPPHQKQPRKEEYSVQQGVPPYGAQVATNIRFWYDQPSRGCHLLCMCAVR